MVLVELPASFTEEQKAVVLRYLGEAERFSLTEWVTLLEGFTTLESATLLLGEEKLTFQEFYDRFIDGGYSDSFIADLIAEADLSARAAAIQARYARQIWQKLRAEPFGLGTTVETRCLLAYCLYWWASFGRGYAFELEITRDLETAGVPFTAHDLRIRGQRFSPCDLMVLGMLGDIKNSTYFLFVTRSFPLTNDFYISRLYDAATRRYRRIVILQEEAWHRINGEAVISDLEHTARLLPQVVGIQFLGYDLIVVDYEIWKQKVLQHRQKGGEPR